VLGFPFVGKPPEGQLIPGLLLGMTRGLRRANENLYLISVWSQKNESRLAIRGGKVMNEF
jgi:hypothetical protein